MPESKKLTVINGWLQQYINTYGVGVELLSTDNDNNVLVWYEGEEEQKSKRGSKNRHPCIYCSTTITTITAVPTNHMQSE